MLAVKVILLFVLGLIFYQDIKERQVYWFLFPLVAICVGVLFFFKTLSELFIMAIALNILFVAILLLAVLLYTKIKLKSNKAIGLGDVLFFLASAFAFSTISFIVIFIGSLIFSLVLHNALTKSQNTITVPLAGYMSLFFGLTYLAYWFGIIQSVYQV